jgi:hypothetical protein
VPESQPHSPFIQQRIRYVYRRQWTTPLHVALTQTATNWSSDSMVSTSHTDRLLAISNSQVTGQGWPTGVSACPASNAATGLAHPLHPGLNIWG